MEDSDWHSDFAQVVEWRSFLAVLEDIGGSPKVVHLELVSVDELVVMQKTSPTSARRSVRLVVLKSCSVINLGVKVTTFRDNLAKSREVMAELSVVARHGSSRHEIVSMKKQNNALQI